MSCIIFGMGEFEWLEDCLLSKEEWGVGKVNPAFARRDDVLLVVTTNKA